MASELSNTLELLNKSISAAGVSSAEHAIDKFANDIVLLTDDEYELPDSYGVDTLRCMSVNINTVYVYWEITQALLERYLATDSELLLKLMADDSVSELMNFHIAELVSSRFINIHIPNRKIQAVIGVERDGGFVEMMRSNIFSTPSDDVTLSTDEFWMSRSEHLEHIIKASIASGASLSSIDIVRELEYLRKQNKNIKSSLAHSSFTLSTKA